MRATVNTALSALVMLMLAVSSANATVCLRTFDNRQYKLLFYKDSAITHMSVAEELWLQSDEHTLVAKIIDQNSAHLIAAKVNWSSSKPDMPRVTTFHFDRIQRRIAVHETDLVENRASFKLYEFLCTKAQN